MMKKILITLALVLSFTGFVGLPVYAQSSKDAVCNGIGAATGANGCQPSANTPDINGTIATVVNILSIIVAIIAVIMIIIGGIKFITSSGDASNVTSAKNTILYAIVGLVVVAFAQIIVKFVLKRVTK